MEWLVEEPFAWTAGVEMDHSLGFVCGRVRKLISYI